MSYVRKIIGSDEKLLATFRPHWIYLFQAVTWLAGLSFLGFLLDYYLYAFLTHNAIKFNVDLYFIIFTEKFTPIPWIFVFTGAAVFLPLFLVYISTEVGLTNQRIIHKRGFLFIEIDQVDLEDIRSEHIIHGWFGWLLNYGRVKLDCRFVHDVILPAIRNPYRLVKTSHAARLKNPKIDYGQDEFWQNMERVEQQRSQARAKAKLATMKEKMKTGFRKASSHKAVNANQPKKPPSKAA